MSAKFQLYYVSVQYGSDRIPLSLTASHFRLLVTPVTGDGPHYTAKAVIYPEVVGKPAQLGVRSAYQPQVRHSDGTLVPMRQVAKPGSDEAYWVEDGVWAKTYQNYIAKSRNTIGAFTILCDGQQCVVELSAGSRPFSDAEYLSMLDDFQQSLFDLLVDENGSVSHSLWTTVPIFGSEFEQLLRDFIKYAKLIMDAPTNELRETQELRKFSRVRPVRRTFMEIACKGMSEKLTSRAHQASYNTPENRYVAALVNKVHRFVKNASKMLEGRQRTLERTHQRNLDRIIEINRIEAEGWQDVIDQAQMEYELLEAKSELDEWRRGELKEWEKQVRTRLDANLPTDTPLRIKIDSKSYNRPHGAGKLLKIKCRRQHEMNFNDQKYILELPARLWFDGLFEKTWEYDICVRYQYENKRTSGSFVLPTGIITFAGKLGYPCCFWREPCPAARKTRCAP